MLGQKKRGSRLGRKESFAMTYNPKHRRPPRLEPMSPGATPPLYQDEDGDKKRRAGVIITAVIALVAVVGLIMWFGPTGPQISDNPPAVQTTTGQGGQPTSPPGPKK
jgi:hypothetical protein